MGVSELMMLLYEQHNYSNLFEAVEEKIQKQAEDSASIYT